MKLTLTLKWETLSPPPSPIRHHQTATMAVYKHGKFYSREWDSEEREGEEKGEKSWAGEGSNCDLLFTEGIRFLPYQLEHHAMLFDSDL